MSHAHLSGNSYYLRGGSFMRIIIVCCLFLSIIFLLLARANKSRKKTWVKAFRLKATVTRIRYSESRPSRDIIDDDKSSTEVTLGFSCLGQDYEKIREYKGILKAPSRPGYVSRSSLTLPLKTGACPEKQGLFGFCTLFWPPSF